MADIFSYALWPGIAGVETIRYECTHGITPNTAILVTSPMYLTAHQVQLLGNIQPIFNQAGQLVNKIATITARSSGNRAVPASRGDLVLGDNRSRTILRDCLCNRVGIDKSGRGYVLTLEILDRRWKWLFGAVSGHYNAIDERGKLVPWTIRSPVELARLLFRELDEFNPLIDLPPGLSRADGANLERYLMAGENFRYSNTNPEQVWDVTPPAVALAGLANEFGCSVVYQPNSNRVGIFQLGKPYKTLPTTQVEYRQTVVNDAPKPSRVIVRGSPVMIQARWQLEPVGKDWHGFYVPINQLSYAPASAGATQISQVKHVSGTPGNIFVTVKVKDEVGKEYVFDVTVTGLPVAGLLDGARDKLNAKADFGKFFVLERLASPERLKITAKVAGQPFSLDAGLIPAADGWATENLQLAVNPFNSWAHCPPPYFMAVQPTDRLSYREAQALARESVWKCYRIRMVDPENGMKPPYVLPWFGPVKRRQQIILLPNKVELVVPSQRIPGAVNKDNTMLAADIVGNALGFNFLNLIPQNILAGVLPEFYNGHARAQKSIVRGEVIQTATDAFWFNNSETFSFNTPKNSRVFADFDTIASEQMIKFTDYVYYIDAGSGAQFSILPPQLELEAACYVLDENTNQIIRWNEELMIGGEGPPEVQIKPDIKVGIIPKYPKPEEVASPVNKRAGHFILDEADNRARAGYYLRGMARKYQTPVGEFIKYMGFTPVDPDGFIRQVTYESPLCSTLVSTNSEHSNSQPDFAVRQRREMMPPNKAAQMANQIEKSMVSGFLPQPVQPK